jgi:hypothetical protein
MIVEETFYRPAEWSRETRTLPAATYNLAHLLVSRATHGCVFVPIRRMQFLAVLDAQEMIFVDREGARRIALAWQAFLPSERLSLEDPVAYQAVYYGAEGPELMKRLQGEFQRALTELRERAPSAFPARIVALPKP